MGVNDLRLMSNSSRTLPAEILDHVFSYLQNDPVTLRSIDDVCLETHNRFLRGILDRHLYAHIVVTNFISTRPGLFLYYKLFQYLSNNPHVSKYIRTLQIEIDVASPFQWTDPISSILRMLRSTLEGISLSTRSRTLNQSKAKKAPMMLDWSGLHETFRKAFLDCLRSSNLIDASIHFVKGIPLSIFNGCTMQKISLRRVEVSSSPLIRFPPQTSSFRIDNVPSESTTRIRDWAQSGPNLRSLNFSSNAEFSFAHFLKELSAESLTDLRLDFGTLFMWPYPPPQVKLKMNRPLGLDISRLPSLTKLTVWASISWSSWITSAIPSIAKVANTSPSLQQLILRMKIDPRCIDGIINPKIWESLVSLTACPSLKHIELGIISKSSKERGVPGIISTFLRVPQLKNLYKKGFLSLKEVDESL